MNWSRFEELRPDQLEQLVRSTPIAYWPLGLIEHHSWHLPVGFDGIKAERFCMRMAERTGGVLLPTMWWGSLGGHGDFKWTFYCEQEASGSIVLGTVEKLIRYGFKVIVLLEGHYPWEGLLNCDSELDRLRAAHPEVLILDGTEVSIAEDERLPEGDHAALQETLYGIELLGELIDLTAQSPGRLEKDVWPSDIEVQTLTRFPGVEYDASKANYAQMGESALSPDRKSAEQQTGIIVDRVVESVLRFLESIDIHG